jgi:hypothetical protein
VYIGACYNGTVNVSSTPVLVKGTLTHQRSSFRTLYSVAFRTKKGLEQEPGVLSLLSSFAMEYVIGVTWQIALGEQSRSWILGALIYKGVKLERWGSFA